VKVEQAGVVEEGILEMPALDGLEAAGGNEQEFTVRSTD